MKNVLTILLIIISIHTFSQKELNREFRTFFNAKNVEENHFEKFDVTDKFNFQIFDEIQKAEDLKKYMISEKKFIFQLNKNSILIEEKIKIDKKESPFRSVSIDLNDDFLAYAIARLYLENDQLQEIITNDADNYGEKTIVIYKNLSDLEDKLLVNYLLSKNYSIQLGNTILPYINKIFKTEVEKTLNTSLNLLAVNF